MDLGNPRPDHAGFRCWLAEREDSLLARIEDRFAVYVEDVTFRHSVFYDRLPDFFFESDVYDMVEGRWLDTPSRRVLLDGAPVPPVPVLYEGPAETAPHPSALVGVSAFSSGEGPEAGLMEGVYGKVEEGGAAVSRFKWVREDFVRLVAGSEHWRSAPRDRNLLACPSPGLPDP